MSLFSILKAVSVRLMLLLHTLLTIWRVSIVYGDIYYLLFLAVLPFILEGLYTVIKRNGIEWKWICPCFVLYLLATIPNIWLLEIDRTKTFGSINTTAVDDVIISGIKIPLKLPADTWVLVIEESLLYLMIIGRWLLPRGRVSREQLSELLFTFIGIASDIMELFALFDEEPVRGSLIFTYALLGVWSWSLLQFTMVLTVASKPIRISLIEEESKMICIEPDKKKSTASFEVLATVVSLFMQDGPFLVMRLYTIIEFNLVNYSLIFFTTKNVLVILLLLYRLFVKCSDKCCPDADDDKGANDDDFQIKKLSQHQLTREDIIAALMKDANTVRKRKTKQQPDTNFDSIYGGRSDITVQTIVQEDIPFDKTFDIDFGDGGEVLESQLDNDGPSASGVQETLKNNGSIINNNGTKSKPKKVVLVVESDKNDISSDFDNQETPSPIRELDNMFTDSCKTAL
ncbi:transmembrane protein 26 [Patella vulgata]|uniref:transmembrane protein 26 n=1 Tax=Patella vulgata TaxID=6465 RepID=UPI0021806E12|nr:transmembrane protein 26 [Patella vulgata]